ncbi:MAG: hypothetical protein JST63_15775 [Bacteroidetes bacterium]|nr:hypothetical protein [Bacteroidota bacterium]
MGDRVNIRIPFVEVLGMQYGDVFSSGGRMLVSSEKDILIPIFGASVSYEKVRIVTSSVIAAPTTLGNYIRIPPGYSISNATLVHEMTHIWQYQTRGNSYISDSLVHQTAAIISGGDRNAAYNYTIVPGQAFSKYTAEQQAMIVEDFYSKSSLRNNIDYKRLIEEVKSARPVMTDMDRYMESLYGNGNRSPRYFDPNFNGVNNTGVAPLFRIEF